MYNHYDYHLRAFIISTAKEILYSRGFGFETVLKDADTTIICWHYYLKQKNQKSFAWTYDSDIAVKGDVPCIRMLCTDEAE